MKIFFVLAAFLAAAAAASYEDVLFQEWNLYKAQHNKAYESPLDNFRRMEIFLQNKYEVAQHNLRYQKGEETYEMEINEFSDWLPEEIDAMNGFNKDLRERAAAGEEVIFPELDAEMYEDNFTATASDFNWADKGAVAPVKNQGACGSCYAFSALGSLESLTYLKTKKLVRLSEQQIVDCSSKYGNLGCNGGSSTATYNYIKDIGGVNTESSYPYEGKVKACRYNKNNNAATCSGYVKVAVNEETLKNALASVGPISVAVNVLDSFTKYKSGIYSDPKCKSNTSNLNHAVLLVGYGTDAATKKDYWIVKNSWGTAWGEKGYIRMARNMNNMCGIATYAVYPRV